ncbi:MAG: hypothetical protein N4A49_04210 [Marinifilaceae bacterium]|jgi:hypothetical protein|nr:hypothetical protein [Marinifilaceae bacterium]
MNKLKGLIIFILFIALNFNIKAQSISGNPAKDKWMQINTDTVRIIFPEYIKDEAQRVSDYIHELAANNSKSLGGKIKKINIVLQTKTSVPNGYVSVAPYKSEFYATPPQDPYTIGGDDFFDALSVHEYRHAMQFANMKKGFANVLYFLQGENGWGTFANLTVPNWFFEGDAVINETAVTNGGRGRLPAFQNRSKANWLADKSFKYKNIRQGSFKHSLPNHYEYGYLLCLYLREKYGNDIWSKVLHNTTLLRRLIYPFSNSLRMHTGLSTKELYNEAYAYFGEKYKEKLKSVNLNEGLHITSNSKDFTAYNFASVYNKDIYALKTSYSKIPEIVKIDHKTNIESKICNPSISYNEGFSIANDKICFSEYSPNPRWSNENYSDIVIFDLQSGRRKTITKKGKYFSPEFSKNAKNIIAVKYTKELNSYLVVIDAETGREKTQFQTKFNDYFMYPKWIDDDNVICTTRKKGVFSILKVNIKSKKEEVLWGPFNQTVTDIELVDDKLFFSASFTGIDNIFSLDLKTKKIYQISSVPVGAYWPCYDRDNNQILYSNYKADGVKLMKINLTDVDFNKEFTPVELHKMKQFDNIAIKSEGGEIIQSAKHRSDSVTKYNKLSHLIKPIGWGLTSTDQETGISISSENILNTLRIDGNYSYNKNEKNSSYGASLIYAGCRVIPVFSASLINDRELEFFNKLKYDEKNVSLILNYPYDFSSGLNTRNLNLFSGIRHYSINYESKAEILFNDFNFNDYVIGLNLFNIRRTARKNIGYRWGQNLSFNYSKSFENEKAEELKASLAMYFPGLMVNHNIEINSRLKWKNSNYSYSDDFVYARGYETPNYKQIAAFSVDYNFPIAYPEFGINGIFHSNRIAAKLFFDYNFTDFNNSIEDKKYRSYGGEIYFNCLLANILSSEIGFRNSILLDNNYGKSKKDNSKFEVVFRITM